MVSQDPKKWLPIAGTAQAGIQSRRPLKSWFWRLLLLFKNKGSAGARVGVRLTAEYVCGGKWGPDHRFKNQIFQRKPELLPLGINLAMFESFNISFSAGLQIPEASCFPHSGRTTISTLNPASTISCWSPFQHHGSVLLSNVILCESAPEDQRVTLTCHDFNLGNNCPRWELSPDKKI